MHRLLLLLAGSLTACAAPGYWYKVRDPIPVEHIVEVDFPCGNRSLDGCANLIGRTIELKRGMPATQRDCVLRHEKHHFEGYDHHQHVIAYAIDCGDGTLSQFDSRGSYVLA